VLGGGFQMIALKKSLNGHLVRLLKAGRQDEKSMTEDSCEHSTETVKARPLQK
jgi:hypothetical protein